MQLSLGKCAATAALVVAGLTGNAGAMVLSNTVAAGTIGEFGTAPGVALAFNLGGKFSSITSVTLRFDPCGDPGADPPSQGCVPDDTIGKDELVILTLGPDTFSILSTGLAATILAPLDPSSALVADLLDGLVSALVSIGKVPTADFTAGVGGADITLTVEGKTVPEPATLALLGLGLGLTGWLRRRRNVHR